jgi:dTDP-4-amino-4,6-dideoxygalactose transaminase
MTMHSVARPLAAPPDFIEFAPPSLGPEEIREVVDTLQSPWITTGPKTQRFEQEFRDYLGAQSALAVSSCTAALHTALVTNGVRAGDEVITTTLTFTATVNAIEHVGARPVLVDVEPDTLNIDPALVARAITPKTRAIIAVHYAGHPAELDALRFLAAEHNLALIEDAAHALPAHYRGEMIGASANPVAFSFYATKNMTTAEGGMLTGTPEFLEHARIIALHGMSRDAWKRYDRRGDWRYDVLHPGYKYNMTDVQASLGLCQLRKLRAFHQRRTEIASQYTAAFEEEEALETPTTRPHVGHAWHLCPPDPARPTPDRPRCVHRAAPRPQCGRVGAFHSGPPALVLSDDVRLRRGCVSCRRRKLQPNAQPPPASTAQR